MNVPSIFFYQLIFRIGRLEKYEIFAGGGSTSVSNNDAISEDTVRRYLRRRPMTTTDLLKKFRSALLEHLSEPNVYIFLTS